MTVPEAAVVGAATLIAVWAASSAGHESAVTANAATVAPLDARQSRYIEGNLSPELRAGRQGRIDVIAIGRYGRSGGRGDFLGDVSLVLPIVIRNNTNRLLRGDVSLRAEGATPTGTVTSSEPRNLDPVYPNIVKPGEIAFGHVYFDGKPLPPETTFAVVATQDPDVESPFTDLALPYRPRRNGDYVFLTARNPTPFTFGGRGHVNLMCFGKGGSILGYYSGSHALWRFKPDFRDFFRVGPLGRCPIYLVTAVARARIH